MEQYITTIVHEEDREKMLRFIQTDDLRQKLAELGVDPATTGIYTLALLVALPI